MHTLAPAVLADLSRRFGTPAAVALDWAVSPEELQFVRATSKGGTRCHDVTLLIFGPDGRLALIQKPGYPPGVWRNPGGGVAPGEDVAAGAAREALEETGLTVDLERYLLRAHVTFRAPGLAPLPWATHVFTARTSQTELAPRDTGEIRACHWFTLAELTGPIRQAIRQAPRRLLHYRAWLHDACAAALAGAPLPPPSSWQRRRRLCYNKPRKVRRGDRHP